MSRRLLGVALVAASVVFSAGGASGKPAAGHPRPAPPALPAAAAPSPSPENAAKFIHEMLLAGSMHDMRPEWGNATWGSEGAKILDVADGPCVTQFTGAKTPTGYGPYGYRVTWSRVTSTVVNDKGYALVLGGVEWTSAGKPIDEYPKSGLAFFLNDVQTAGRVRNAFEVLRKACSKSSNLGF